VSTEMKIDLKDELHSFNGLWRGGYFEGDPLDPMGVSGYGQLGFVNTLYATYLRCIKPYINANTVALEIGPGRGGWTKTMLSAKEICVLDALPEDHNGFREYIGEQQNVKYFQVEDFLCGMLPNNHFDFMFSYGCLCHVSFEGIKEYAKNLYPKLKSNSNCFWMVADYEKYNSAMSNFSQLNVFNALLPKSLKYLPVRLIFSLLSKFSRRTAFLKDEDNIPRPGRWYNAGIARTCEMLAEAGYRIIDSDVSTCLRDPVIHFQKL